MIDYQEQDFAQAELKYGIIFDVVEKSPDRKCLKCLSSEGRYVLANDGFTPMLPGTWTSKTPIKL